LLVDAANGRAVVNGIADSDVDDREWQRLRSELQTQ